MIAFFEQLVDIVENSEFAVEYLRLVNSAKRREKHNTTKEKNAIALALVIFNISYFIYLNGYPVIFVLHLISNDKFEDIADPKTL